MLITWPQYWSHDLNIDHMSLTWIITIGHMTLTLITWPQCWSHDHWSHNLDVDHMTLTLITWPQYWSHDHWSHDLDVGHMTLMCLSSQHKVSKSMRSIVRALKGHTDWQPFLLMWPWPWTSDHQLDVDIMSMKSEVTKSRLWNIRASDTRTHRHRRDLTHDHAVCHVCVTSHISLLLQAALFSEIWSQSMYVCPQGYWCS